MNYMRNIFKLFVVNICAFYINGLCLIKSTNLCKKFENDNFSKGYDYDYTLSYDSL